jgi:SAM-dependent methyltransferase
MTRVLSNIADRAILHFAPERFFRSYFATHVAKYHTADLEMADVDYHVDLQQLPFADCSYDFVLASNVLEYVASDRKAIAEIRRVLRPTGVAILPVSVTSKKTLEYTEPNPCEAYQTRACGVDYFDRYREYFSDVQVLDSSSFLGKHQRHIYEDRTHWPTPAIPLRQSMPGEKHLNFVSDLLRLIRPWVKRRVYIQNLNRRAQ